MSSFFLLSCSSLSSSLFPRIARVLTTIRVTIILTGPIPSIFGLHIATYIVCSLAGKPILNPLAVRGRHKLYDRLYKDLLHREEKLTGRTPRVMMHQH